MVRTALVIACAGACAAGLAPGSATPGGAETESAAAAPAQRDASVFVVDLAHSTIIYRIRHFGLANFYGRILAPDGEFRLDEDDLGSSFVNIIIDIKRMDAGNDQRDAFLLSPDFFNVREYPKATFKSKSVRKIAEGAYEATGEFTMRGVTKPLTVKIEQFATGDFPGFGHRAGFETTFTIKRTDFGMQAYLKDGTLGDEVQITAAIQGYVDPDAEDN